MKISRYGCLAYAVGLVAIGVLWVTGGRSFDAKGLDRGNRVIQEELDGIVNRLRHYARDNGRYPDNNEGLTVLYRNEKRVDLRKVFRHHDPDTIWQMSQAGLVKCVDSVATGICDCVTATGEVGQANYAILHTTNGGGNATCVLCGETVVSPGLLPYIYENRKGLGPEQFRHSLTDHRPDWRFWREIDGDVRVYSVEGYYIQLERAIVWWKHTFPQLCVTCLVVLLLCWTAFTRRTEVLRVIAFLVMGALTPFVFVLLWWLFMRPAMMCYYVEMSRYRRNPRAVPKQLELIEQYHTNGVINDETYRRLMEATKGQEHGSEQ